MRTIGTIIPTPKIIMHGALRPELYIFPASLRPFNAISRASPVRRFLSAESGASDAETIILIAKA